MNSNECLCRGTQCSLDIECMCVRWEESAVCGSEVSPVVKNTHYMGGAKLKSFLLVSGKVSFREGVVVEQGSGGPVACKQSKGWFCFLVCRLLWSGAALGDTLICEIVKLRGVPAQL